MPTSLVDLSVATSELAASLPSDTSALQNVLYAATRAIQRWSKRDFIEQPYVEYSSGRGYSSILLRQYPVVPSSLLVSVNPQVILTVSNTDSTTNQRAYAGLASTGDLDSGLTITGLTLVRIASGTKSTNTITFSSLSPPTIQSLANSINGIGGGWKATPASGYELWGASELYSEQSQMGCLSSNQACFGAFVTDITDYTLDARTGEVRFNNNTFDPVFSLMNIADSTALSVFNPGFRNIKSAYTAGFSTIPADIQQACLVTVKEWMYDLQISTQYKMERDKDFSYTLNDFGSRALPESVMKMLQPWRSFRGF